MVDETPSIDAFALDGMTMRVLGNGINRFDLRIVNSLTGSQLKMYQSGVFRAAKVVFMLIAHANCL